MNVLEYIGALIIAAFSLIVLVLLVAWLSWLIDTTISEG